MGRKCWVEKKSIALGGNQVYSNQFNIIYWIWLFPKLTDLPADELLRSHSDSQITIHTNISNHNHLLRIAQKDRNLVLSLFPDFNNAFINSTQAHHHWIFYQIIFSQSVSLFFHLEQYTIIFLKTVFRVTFPEASRTFNNFNFFKVMRSGWSDWNCKWS